MQDSAERKAAVTPGTNRFLGLFLFKDVISLGVSFYLISYFGQKAILSEAR